MKNRLSKVYHVSGTANQKWWQKAVIYEIYPRSFQDSDGDGVGDLGGIIDRLDYLVELGVDLIWICPIYASPMSDFGYDVSDYCDIHPMFGDLDTFDRLLSAAQARDLKVVLDFVPNHTSIEHPWFQESCSSRHNPKRDWYIWKDPLAQFTLPYVDFTKSPMRFIDANKPDFIVLINIHWFIQAIAFWLDHNITFE